MVGSKMFKEQFCHVSILLRIRFHLTAQEEKIDLESTSIKGVDRVNVNKRAFFFHVTKSIYTVV